MRGWNALGPGLADVVAVAVVVIFVLLTCTIQGLRPGSGTNGPPARGFPKRMADRKNSLSSTTVLGMDVYEKRSKGQIMVKQQRRPGLLCWAHEPSSNANKLHIPALAPRLAPHVLYP